MLSGIPEFKEIPVVGMVLSPPSVEETATLMPSEEERRKSLRPAQYEGTRTAHGVMDGRGSLVIQGTCRYAGEWKMGKRHGAGRYSSINPKTAEATATASRRSERVYEGEWREDEKAGYGCFERTDGSFRYEGEWQGDQMNGVGSATQVQGGLTYTYEGHWRDHIRNGRGAYVWPGGNTWYYGNFNDNKVLGVGMYVSTFGKGSGGEPAVYFGSWSPTGALLRGFCSTQTGFYKLHEERRRKSMPVRKKSLDVNAGLWEEVEAVLHSLNYESNADAARPFYGSLFLQRIGKLWGGLIHHLLDELCNPMFGSVLVAFRIFNILAHVFNGVPLDHHLSEYQKMIHSGPSNTSSGTIIIPATPLFCASLPNELEVCRAVLMCLQQQISLTQQSLDFLDICCAGICAVHSIGVSSLQARAWLLRHQSQFEQMLDMLPIEKHLVLELQVAKLRAILQDHRFDSRFQCFHALRPRVDVSLAASSSPSSLSTSSENTNDNNSEDDPTRIGIFAPCPSNLTISVEDYIHMFSRDFSDHPFVHASKSIDVIRESVAGLFRVVVSIDVARLDLSNTIIIDLTDEYHIRSCFNISSFDKSFGPMSDAVVASVTDHDVLFLSRYPKRVCAN